MVSAMCWYSKISYMILSLGNAWLAANGGNSLRNWLISTSCVIKFWIDTSWVLWRVWHMNWHCNWRACLGNMCMIKSWIKNLKFWMVRIPWVMAAQAYLLAKVDGLTYNGQVHQWCFGPGQLVRYSSRILITPWLNHDWRKGPIKGSWQTKVPLGCAISKSIHSSPMVKD